MIEVEVKLRIEDAVLIAANLESQGFEKGNYVKETDIYFNGVDRDFWQTDEALRIRKTKSLDGYYLISDYDEVSDKQPNEIYLMTYKGKKLDQVSMSRQEIELQIGDFEAMKDVLISLGFKPVLPVVKSRQYYHSEQMVACLDYVEGLGHYLELEICVDSEDDRENALKLIEQQLHAIGYGMQNTTTMSYLRMLMSISSQRKIRGENH